MTTPVIVWFRQDLRLADHPALAAAATTGRPVIPVYVWSPDDDGDWPPGAASRVWLHHSLQSLATELGRLDSRLVVRSGDTVAVLQALCRETGADTVYCHRRHEPAARKLGQRLQTVLGSAGIDVSAFDAGTLFRPESLTNRSGQPYKVFTAFWKHCLSRQAPSEPHPSPKALVPPEAWPDSTPIAALELLPRNPDWAGGIHGRWRPGTQAAEQRLADFIAQRLDGYVAGRDQPADDAVSGLSASLHFGEIGVREIWHAVRSFQAAAGSARFSQAADAFLRQLGWREFALHLLHHFPDSVTEPMAPAFRRFPWREDAAGLRAWQQGQTGFPFVDAGMRELWQTGYMHNRVRMVVASFLVKDLMLHWLHGAHWFWDTLVDADLANNTMGWQWCAGCGVDAAPYFRVFNPVRQSERFDPDGHYLRRWVPELAGLSARDIHAPWQASESTLRRAGVRLAEDYPRPIVDHDAARKRALAALESMRGAGD